MFLYPLLFSLSFSNNNLSEETIACQNLIIWVRPHLLPVILPDIYIYIHTYTYLNNGQFSGVSFAPMQHIYRRLCYILEICVANIIIYSYVVCMCTYYMFILLQNPFYYPHVIKIKPKKKNNKISQIHTHNTILYGFFFFLENILGKFSLEFLYKPNTRIVV